MADDLADPLQTRIAAPPARRPSRRAVDRRWRLWAAGGRRPGACLLRACSASSSFPPGQRENARLSHGQRDAPRRRPGGRLAGRRPAARPRRHRFRSARSAGIPAIMQHPRRRQYAARRSAGGADMRRLPRRQRACRQTNIPSLAGPDALRHLQAASRLSHRRSRPSANDRRCQAAFAVGDLASIAAYYAAASKEYAAIGGRDLSGEGRKSSGWRGKATAAAAFRPA